MSTVLVRRPAAVEVAMSQDRTTPRAAATARDSLRARPDRRALMLVHASLLLAAILWGGNATATKFLLGSLEPFDLSFLRAAGTALLAGFLLLRSRRRLIPMPRADALRLVAIGVIGITGVNLAFVNGQRLVPAALASVIVTSNPIFTAVLSRVLTGERLGGRKVGGTALAFLGLLVVVLYGSGQGATLAGGKPEGVLIVALAPLAWACYTVLS